MTYNVECLNGHVTTAPEGSALEKRCIERESTGYLDALKISNLECPHPHCKAHIKQRDEMRALFDPKHRYAVERYLTGENLD